MSDKSSESSLFLLGPKITIDSFTALIGSLKEVVEAVESEEIISRLYGVKQHTLELF